MEIVEVPKTDDESSASELLRPPEGRFEAMDDEDRDDPPRIEYIRRDISAMPEVSLDIFTPISDLFEIKKICSGKVIYSVYAYHSR